jgi:hypothetical protein
MAIPADDLRSLRPAFTMVGGRIIDNERAKSDPAK